MKIKNKTALVYDIEIFPNLFTCTMKNTESQNHRVFEISTRKNELGQMLSIFKNRKVLMVGYNNLHYDDLIINYLWMNYEKLRVLPYHELCPQLKRISDLIVNSKGDKFDELTKYKYAHNFESLDLLAMLFSNKLRVGLKEMQVTMQYHNVREYEGDFNRPVPLNEIDDVISYNINDVDSTEELLNRCVKDIELRLGIEKKYHIKALNKDGVNLGMEIIKTRYLEKTGLTWDDIKDLRSPCERLCLTDIIFNFIKFEHKDLQDLLRDLKNQCIDPSDNTFKRNFIIGGVQHTFGLGGLHSVNTPEIFEPSDDYVLADKDVTSLYPSIVIEHGVCPEHLNKDVFVGNFADMKAERVAAKKAGDTITNMTLKLALNGFTGNLQSQYSWVYSPKAALTIRINGQLMLLMLLERLDDLGVRIIQSNTDGVFFMHHKNITEDVERVCTEWEKITKLNLETDYFERFYQYAINDYLGVKKGWSETHDPKFIKTKGLFIDTVSLGKGMAPKIIAECLKQYFVNKIPVDDTLMKCKDIKQFLTYQKVKKEFSVEYAGELITHINRYFMSTNGWRLRRCVVDKNGKRTKYADLCATSGVTIFNEFEDLDPSKAHINYNWYRQEIYKIIYPLEDSLNPVLF